MCVLCSILRKEAGPILKNKKLKRTAIFIGLFLAAILLTFIIASIFRSPPEPDPDAETTVVEETTTAWEESSTEEENTTTQFEWITEPTTTTVTTTTRSTASSNRTSTTQSTATKPTAAPPRTTAPPTTTRASVTTTKPPETTTRTTTRTTTTTRSTTTTRPTTTTTRPPTTTNITDSLIAFGVNYGKSIGLTYRPQLTQGGEAISNATQQAIRAKLDQAKAFGATEFNIYSVRQGNTQTIYIIWKR